ncbi:hypothetical protein [Thioalkalivibrio sp. ARh3]|uniref:hypothetical protein n=1 Tax=Thioalkalivibrio sp. ARh3 TaxID=1158148 RepID=UPI00037546A6|nr:hypothetical protein [Thioalkalivibrio sp. ARh3]
MSDKLEALRRLRGDFPLYSRKALTIRGKQGVGPFKLNDAQMYLHEQLEEQLAATGQVRALALKGRQQGVSTYVQGRYYWKTTGGWGKRAFILTHEDAATGNLFEMTKRYHENCPVPLRPRAQRASATELYFDRLDSGYKVGTAKTKGTGRSGTLQYFHGSEVAWWPNQRDHMAGVLQAVPSGEAGEGTEIILETTANGVGEMFHELWQQAERGASEFIPVFIPWFWQKEYRSPVPAGFELSQDEQEYQALHGLEIEQMVWRRNKIETEFGGEAWLFKQEYPAIPAEAFQVPNARPLIHPEDVVRAMSQASQPSGPKVLGVDVARQGKDRSALALRQGRVAHFVSARHEPDLMAVAGWVASVVKLHKPDAIHVDASGGYGASVVDRLREMGVPNVVEVQFGGRARERDKYKDKRSEMWGEMKEWFARGAVSVPNQADLQTDLLAPQHGHDSSGRMWLERKEDMAKRGVSSPDKGDALALTFAEPVMAQQQPHVIAQREYRPASAAGY